MICPYCNDLLKCQCCHETLKICNTCVCEYKNNKENETKILCNCKTLNTNKYININKLIDYGSIDLNGNNMEIFSGCFKMLNNISVKNFMNNFLE